MPFLLLIIAISLVVLTWSFWSVVLEAGARIAAAALALVVVIWIAFKFFEVIQRVVSGFLSAVRGAYHWLVYGPPPAPPPPSDPEPPTDAENWGERIAEAARRAERERRRPSW